MAAGTAPSSGLPILAVVLTGLVCFTSSGLIFGLSSLYPVLYDKGVFTSSCGTNSSICSTSEGHGTKCCDAQLSSLTAMSTVGFFMSDASMVLYGEVNDRVGPRACFSKPKAKVFAKG